MKLKRLAILAILLLVFTTGCTDRFTDKKTDQAYVSNIMCQPTDKDTLEVYSRNTKQMDVKISELPKCTEFKVTDGEYENLFSSLFVKPLAWLILKLGELIGKYGISIMIMGLLLRIIMIPLTKKSMLQSEQMKKAQPEIKKLEKKYRNKTDKESLMLKSQETMAIYKKYEINPMAGCIFAFLQLPIFFAFLEAIYRIPAFFEENLWGLDLGTTPYIALQTGSYYYLIIVALIILTTYFSFKNMNMASADPAQEKQMKMMVIFMLVFISIASFTLPIAIALYWIASSAFSIGQNIYIKKVTLKKDKKVVKEVKK